MRKNFESNLNELLEKNEKFLIENKNSSPQYDIIKAMLNARKSKNLTQQALSEITGINQADICKIEKGNSNPSIKTLQRLANGMDMTLHIEFIQNKN